MTFRGAVLKFKLARGDALKRLVTECGYSKPESPENIVLHKTFQYGTAEIRKQDDTLMVLIRPEGDEAFVEQMVSLVLKDLAAVNLFNDIPF